MSMICLNPLACSFMDLQFPNGQLTYVAGEGFTSSAFVPVLDGLLRAQGKYPGETRISFSFRNKLGTRVTPMIRLPDKSFSVKVDQPMAWKQTGIMIKPSVQLRFVDDHTCNCFSS
ncbi:epstein-barr nuclear antigen [Rhynchospora pubera]|uniref:Epstein-barr nuclear antigen n=1 Tax=Rhynchospora pubera TaxID=906938 RepID=A0AAV8BZR7_9POAL|nr:epstein-barr nuclear antigen [Rhynchospora pubera]